MPERMPESAVDSLYAVMEATCEDSQCCTRCRVMFLLHQVSSITTEGDCCLRQMLTKDREKKKKKKKSLTSFGQPTRLITCADHGNNVMCSWNVGSL